MYKSPKTYKYISLTMQDLYELENLTRKNMSDNLRSYVLINSPDRDFDIVSLNEFNLEESKITKVNYITMRFNQDVLEENSKYVYIDINNYEVRVRIEGHDEVWVNGFSLIINKFFKKKKSLIAQLNRFIPLIGGGLIGTSIALIQERNSLPNVSLLIFSILLTLFFLVGVYFNKGVINSVKLNLKPKEEINWTAIGGIAAIITLIVTVIFGLLK